MASVSLSRVGKRFGDIVAVEDLTLSIADGEFFVLLGPSGAGKTTTLRLIAGLERPDAGDVSFDGSVATGTHPSERDVAFVFQQFSLYPHFSVYDNLAFPLRSPKRRLPEAEIRKKVTAVADTLHIGSKLDNPSTALSGGEMQRVAIGRALVREPRVFLMDEPLSSLDAKLREEMRLELKRLQRHIGATILYVTHDQTEATTLADRIGILEHGRLIQIGSPREIYGDPASLSAAQRLGSPPINVLPPVLFGESSIPGGTAAVTIRPEDVVVGDASEPRSLQLEVQEYSPLRHLLILNGGNTAVVAITTSDRMFVPGEKVGVVLPPQSLLFFSADGRRIRS
jgi:multiple sugar transport system ATP-binding protein